ncbi:molybdopterin synthase [Halobellus sp. EA9]|uniref:molybdopterin synthase n=1 Tax=Halobellus sp. EA9 TaxID=3421647 RepID=UPI003EB8A66B
MQVLGVVGAGASALCERVAPHLDGRVAVVERRAGDADGDSSAAPESDADRPDGVDTAYALGDGSWSAAGGDRSLDDVLDDLAPAYDHALLVGFPDAAFPTVALGDAAASNVALDAADADAVDVESVLAAIADAEPHVTLEALVERVKASPRADRAGAIATFTGRVRTKDGEDDPETLELTFEKYEGVAEERMREIESELMERDGVQEVVCFHRTGTLRSGEDIVFVVVLAGHREEAFETVSDGINRLKDEVPIFKRETTVEEDFWVHDRQ